MQGVIRVLAKNIKKAAKLLCLLENAVKLLQTAELCSDFTMPFDTVWDDRPQGWFFFVQETLFYSSFTFTHEFKEQQKKTCTKTNRQSTVRKKKTNHWATWYPIRITCGEIKSAIKTWKSHEQSQYFHYNIIKYSTMGRPQKEREKKETQNESPDGNGTVFLRTVSNTHF